MQEVFVYYKIADCITPYEKTSVRLAKCLYVTRLLIVSIGTKEEFYIENKCNIMVIP